MSAIDLFAEESKDQVLIEPRDRSRAPATEALVIKALEAAGGNVSAAAKMLGYTRPQLVDRIRTSAALEDAVVDINETHGDFVEEQLKTLVAEGNTAAVMFTLKTRYADRGYGDKIDVTVQESEELRMAKLTVVRAAYDGEDGDIEDADYSVATARDAYLGAVQQSGPVSSQRGVTEARVPGSVPEAEHDPVVEGEPAPT